MVKAWGELITVILKVVTAKMQAFLKVLSYLPGVGKYAKEV
jgi:phage-related protein